jgi:hypothetical protein
VLTAWDTNGTTVLNKELTPEQLPDYIGKEAANKVLEQKPEDKYGSNATSPGDRTLQGVDLKLGGEGTRLP